LMTNPASIDARPLVSKLRDDRERAYYIRPREWVGTATKTALAFPYNALWGFPEKFYKEPPPENWRGQRACSFSRRDRRTSAQCDFA